MEIIKQLADSIQEDAPIYTLGLIVLLFISFLFFGIFGWNLSYLTIGYIVLLLLVNILYFWAECNHNNWFVISVIIGDLGLFLIWEWVGFFTGLFFLPLLLVSFFED